ncbi:nucleoside deaminase [Blattabacterium cuenoti]|uniref:nucleoside deaminase n=1 Tax=Blattabacterium cuenoti TaxID=1653831 RepID=UPI001EEAA2C3|nr:nucleoside deaminase [Blattabacterium cuenoti]
MSIKDFHFMKIALKEAINAFKINEVPIGAVITYNNIVIAKTHNLTETLNNITAHAEILAIKKASSFLNKKYIKKCTIYVTLEPCIMCAGALYLSKIGKIVCGAPNNNSKGFLYYGIKLHPDTIYISGILKNQCKFLIQDFFFFKRINKKYNHNIFSY